MGRSVTWLASARNTPTMSAPRARPVSRATRRIISVTSSTPLTCRLTVSRVTLWSRLSSSAACAFRRSVTSRSTHTMEVSVGVRQAENRASMGKSSRWGASPVSPIVSALSGGSRPRCGSARPWPRAWGDRSLDQLAQPAARHLREERPNMTAALGFRQGDPAGRIEHEDGVRRGVHDCQKRPSLRSSARIGRTRRTSRCRSPAAPTPAPPRRSR